jgi:hypothetical protein
MPPTKRIPTQPSTPPPSKLMRTDYKAIVKESCKQEATEDEGH